MPKSDKYIIEHRCDEPMKRSKEKCYTPFRMKWKCTGECRSCICCIVKDNYGGERHIGVEES